MSLIARYKLEGNANDETGSFNGTATNVSYVAGKQGQAGSFNGTSSYVEKASPSGINSASGTMACWFNLAALPGSDGTVGVLVAATNATDANNLQTYLGYARESGSTYPLFVIRTNGGSIAWLHRGTSALSASQWYHVTLSRANGSNPALYINGAAQLITASSLGASTGSNTEWWDDFTVTALTIGRRTLPTPGNYANGLIDDARIYNNALTAAEVLALYNSYSSLLLRRRRAA